MAVSYCGFNDLLNYIDQNNLIAMSNDFPGANGVNNNVINSVCGIASRNVDALVSSVYQVPFNLPYPVKVYTAATVFAVELLYNRRMVNGDKNPMKAQGDYWRNELIKINEGELSLDFQSQRSVPPIIATIRKTRLDASIY